MNPTIKGALKSRTIWLSFATMLFGAIQMGLPMLQVAISPAVYGVSTFTIGVLVAVCRWVTVQSLEEKGKPNEPA